MSGLSTPLEITASDMSEKIRTAGVAGAGGAGFPSYPKWERVDEVNHLLINHQESEPNYFLDKWLGKENATDLASLFDALLAETFDTVIIAAKHKDRESWLQELESATDGTVVRPDELPLNPDDHSGVVFAYTDNRYQYGMESVLLNTVADTCIGKDLPMDHGWLVQNTETVYNIYRAVTNGEPVTRKLVHVDGNVDRHRLLDVPIGTPASELFEAAGRDPTRIGDEETVINGGPGWCFKTGMPLEEFSVTKRTNCVMVLEESTVEEHKLGEERIQLLNERDWQSEPLEKEPTKSIDPQRVLIPRITNPSFDNVVSRSEPVVEVGDHVDVGETVATATEGVSIPQHASISGTVAAIEDRHIEIVRDGSDEEASR